MVIAMTAPAPAVLACNQNFAIVDCQTKILSDSRYREAHGTTARETGHNSFRPTGLLKGRMVPGEYWSGTGNGKEKED